jgi:hypothetical protein
VNAAAAQYDVRALGEILDRSVHLTVRRFAVVAPFVLADALGSLIGFLPLRGGIAVATFLIGAMLCENRAQVVALASIGREDRRGVAWSAVFRHPGALMFALVGILDYAVPYLVVGIASLVAFATVSGPGAIGASLGLAFILMIVVVLALLLSLLVALLLFALAAVAATVDVVLDRTVPHRALGRWARLTFRRRSSLTTLLAATVFMLLTIGVPFLLNLVSWGPPAIQTILDAIPEGIADAIALMFAWGWRDLILDRRLGQDMNRLLDAGDHVVPSR